jgi:hypothetical protein
MGVLDDAIREHLELKLKHGASEEDIEKQKAEALGPPRRDAPAAEEGVAGGPERHPEPDEERGGEPVEEEAADRAAAVSEDAPWVEEEPAAGEETAVSEEAAAGEEPEADEVPAGESLQEPRTPPASGPPPAVERSPTVESAPGHTRAQERPTGGEVREERRGRELDEKAADEDVVEEPAGEDVLEETPDFLQETPEHDRLWFEQKPPRDFDFDE